MTAYRIIKEVEIESGLPFAEVVKFYAKEVCYTMHHTALTLGYASHSSFFKLCSKRGWDKWFEGNLPQPGERVYSRVHKMGSPSTVMLELDGVTMPMVGHAKRLGIPVKTVYGRQRKRPGDWTYVFSRIKHNTTSVPVKPARWKR